MPRLPIQKSTVGSPLNVDDKALESMSEIKKMVSEARRRRRDTTEEGQTSVQEQADEVVRRKLKRRSGWPFSGTSKIRSDAAADPSNVF